MTRSRTFSNAVVIAIFTIFCFAVVEFLAVNIGQANPLSSDYTVHAVFANADGLPTAADVRVSGVDVGRVTAISHDPSQPGETVATLQISDSKAVPLYSNGYATVRAKTLLGEKYVDLTVGSSATADSIANGGFLPPAQTAKDVSNDEIFNAFDSRTRAEQQQVIAALDTATFQRSGDIQAILPQLTTVVTDLQPVAAVYEKDQALIATLTAASSFATEINNAMAPTVAAQRQAIQQLGPTLQGQESLLNLVIAPQASCGGQPCGIDQLFTGTLLGNLNYPNNQLTITSRPGEYVADEWDALFSQPNPDNRALNVVISLHQGNPP